MDYLNLKRKSRNRKIAIAVISIIVGLLSARFMLTPAELPNAVKAPLATPTYAATQDNWLKIVQDIDQIRANAIMRRDKSELSKIYTAESLLEVSDTDLIDELLKSNAIVTGLNFKVEAVRKISHRWSNDEEVVELEVTDSRNAYRLQTESENQLIPARPSVTWIISLTKLGEKWFVSNAVQALDDR